MLSVLSYCYFNVYYWIFSLCIVCGSVIMRLSIYLKHPRFFWIVVTETRYNLVLRWHHDRFLRVLLHLLPHRVWDSSQAIHPSPPPSLYVHVQFGCRREIPLCSLVDRFALHGNQNVQFLLASALVW